MQSLSHRLSHKCTQSRITNHGLTHIKSHTLYRNACSPSHANPPLSHAHTELYYNSRMHARGNTHFFSYTHTHTHTHTHTLTHTHTHTHTHTLSQTHTKIQKSTFLCRGYS